MAYQSSRQIIFTFGWVLFFILTPIWAGQIDWVEDSFEDFADGTLDAAGQNIYVSHDGSIRTIHRFDINDDGYLDLFFGNTHDVRFHVPPTLCQVDSNRQCKTSQLAICGSDRVRSADFNKDGYPDLVFALNMDGLQVPRRFIYLLYGGPDGWPSHRSTGRLPVKSPLDIAVVDLNADTWPDIAVINGPSWKDDPNPDGNITVFWGSEKDFLMSRSQKIGCGNAIRLAADDYDSDGANDLAVLSSDNSVTVFWSKPSPAVDHIDFKTTRIELPLKEVACITAADTDADGHNDIIVGTQTDQMIWIQGNTDRKWQKPVIFSGFRASHLSVGDLDGDRYPDIAITYFSMGEASVASVVGSDEDVTKNIQILWGGPEGYAASNATALPAIYAYATAVGDIDHDSLPDLAVAIYQGTVTFEAESVIYFGKGNRQFAPGDHPIATSGATDVVIVPASDQTPQALVFANSTGGAVGEKSPMYIYWGDGKGFDPARRWEIPGQSTHEATSADFNADGYVDLAVTNTIHGGKVALKNPIVGTNIFWGSADGFDIQKRRTVLREPWMPHSNTADLNRDGYLDIVLGGWTQGFDADTRKPAEVVIYYGSDEGFTTERKVAIEAGASSEGTLIADLNKDDYLDIVAVSFDEDCTRIFWGSPEGFDKDRQQRLYQPAPIPSECADLNNDGFLDLIIGSYMDPVDNMFDMGSFIYWGSPQGYHKWNTQWLPGHCTLFYAVADYDGDGFLDIFCPNYHGQLNREEMISYFFWNGPDGFDPIRRTPIIGNSSAGAQAGDFNGDGLIDVAVSNHTVQGNHQTDSMVLYNDGNRFANPKIQLLPTLGAHYMFVEDMGHIYDRSYCHRYTSSVFTFQQPVANGKLTFDATIPKGTTLTFAIRSAKTQDNLTAKPWQSLTGNTFTLDPADRCLQYQAIFKSDNGDRYPILNQISISLIEN